MDDYRSLTEEEIQTLEKQGCTAEDWTAINVDENFSPRFLKDVDFSGEVNLGVFEKNITLEDGYIRHSGIRRAVLRNVTIGDNCIIENIGSYIFNYRIGEDSILMNVGRISKTGDATFGRGNTISVMNESGDGNIILFEGLTSNVADLMIRNSADKEFRAAIRKLIKDTFLRYVPEQGEIGFNVKIINTREITNAIITDNCEIIGASHISECTLSTYPNDTDSGIYIGNDVILENSIIIANASILDGAKVNNCFIGESCHIGKGASVEKSVFFANSYFDNGESCASFCGPFTVSHHKSTLLIGGQYSFFNAGSNTNFSNHAYKMGPIHWGIMERGCKTASGSHILWPATIGSYSMCMGKIQGHPVTINLPFSYVFGLSDGTYIAPGRNITTVGTYRDINKWPKRDMRVANGKKSIINFEWLNPITVQECILGKQILETIKNEQGDLMASYFFCGCNIRNQSLVKGIKFYDLAIRLFLGKTLEQHPEGERPVTSIGSGEWTDLSGLLLPAEREQQLLEDIKDAKIINYADLLEELKDIHFHYEDYKWTWAYRVILNYYQLENIVEEDIDKIKEDYHKAKAEWLKAIKYDAEKEYQLGDVSNETLKDFLEQI